MTVSIYQDEPASEKLSSVLRTFSTLAVIALVSTILLIMIGAIVRVTGNGLGCPDWPLCHGRAVPPFLLSAWVEFLHRLFGAAVSLEIGALIVLSWRWFKPDKWIFRTAIAAAIVLSIQVVLGGIHVVYELPRWTGWIHTGVAMLVAGLVALWVAVTHPATRRLGQRTAATFAGTRLPLWTAISAGATYVLLLTGSLVTRTGASLVCPDFPLCGLPTIPDNIWSLVFIQMAHRVAALVVGVTIILVLYFMLKASRQDQGIKRITWILIGLLTLQLLLGMSNVLLTLPMWSRVLHLGTGATIWVFMVILSATVIRGEDQKIESSLA
jgi:heme A synthase